jgi:hypothetical protein
LTYFLCKVNWLYAMKRGEVASQPCGVVSLPRDATVQ